MVRVPFLGITGFEWDDHNAKKNSDKPAVEPGECEEFFFNTPLIVSPDVGHSAAESRYHALGMTDSGRRLLVVFTLREGRLRVISARVQSRKERHVYEIHS